MNLSMRVHTIGDQAIHLMLDYLEEAEMVYGKKPYLQHTLEHLENLQYEDIARLSKFKCGGIRAAAPPDDRSQWYRARPGTGQNPVNVALPPFPGCRRDPGLRNRQPGG